MAKSERGMGKRPEDGPADPSRRRLLKGLGGLVVAGGLSVMGLGVWTIKNSTGRVLSEAEREAAKRYSKPQPDQLTSAIQEVEAFQKKARELAKNGQTAQIVQIADEAELREAYRVIRQESFFQEEVSDLLDINKIRSLHPKDPLGRGLVMTIGGGGAVALAAAASCLETSA